MCFRLLNELENKYKEFTEIKRSLVWEFTYSKIKCSLWFLFHTMHAKSHTMKKNLQKKKKSNLEDLRVHRCHYANFQPVFKQSCWCLYMWYVTYIFNVYSYFYKNCPRNRIWMVFQNFQKSEESELWSLREKTEVFQLPPSAYRAVFSSKLCT